MSKFRNLAFALVATAMLCDCGGGGGGYGGGGGTQTTTYTVGGSVAGLAPSTSVTLQNGTDTVIVSANGGFTFPAVLPNQSAYNVLVSTDPAGRTCTVINGTGTVVGASVANVTVACTSDTNAPNAGDLVITEVMADPASTDVPKEWFEVLNTAAGTLDLGGVVVTSGLGLFVVPAGTSIPPGSFFVFAGSADPGANGGLLTVNVNYGSALQLANTFFDLRLKAATTTVDFVSLTPMPSGASLALSQSKLTAIDNDSQTNWCTSTTAYGTGTDKGTPGATNADCP